MSYVSWHDITRAARWWRGHPVLGPATATLAALRDASDGFPEAWAYFGEPALAGSALAALIKGDNTARYDRPDTTPEALRAALQPVLEFRAAHGLDFPVTCSMPATPDITPQAASSHDDGSQSSAAAKAACDDAVDGHITGGTPAGPRRPGPERAREVS